MEQVLVSLMKIRLVCISAHAGTSSFGMSGVNAHAIFAPGKASHAAQSPLAPAWQHQRQRYWAIPEPHHLLGPLKSSASGKAPGCAFALDLCKPELAYLGDHMVTPSPDTLVTLCKLAT
jgi:hypothetical protein